MNIFKRFLQNNKKNDQYHRHRASKFKIYNVIKVFDGGLIYYASEIVCKERIKQMLS